MNSNARTEGEGAVRCSAWLGAAPRPRLTNGCALELSDMLLIAHDSGQSATKHKPLESTTDCRSRLLLRLELCGVMVCEVMRCGLTTQAQRPGPRGRSIATWT